MCPFGQSSRSMRKGLDARDDDDKPAIDNDNGAGDGSADDNNGIDEAA